MNLTRFIAGTQLKLRVEVHCLELIAMMEESRITSSLIKNEISHFTEFCERDNNGLPLKTVSAVCCSRYTLYMFTKSGENERQLVLCHQEINGGKEFFLDIVNHEPVALFGGSTHSAAINSEGDVIIINVDSVQNSPSSPITSFPFLVLRGGMTQ